MVAAEQFPTPYPASSADYIYDIADAERASLEVYEIIIGALGDAKTDAERGSRIPFNVYREEKIAALDRALRHYESEAQRLSHHLGQPCGAALCAPCNWANAAVETKGMSPDQKAEWVWRWTDVRPDPIRDTVPSMTDGPDHHIVTEFEGRRPVYHCDGCKAGQNGRRCWGLALWEMALSKYAPERDIA